MARGYLDLYASRLARWSNAPELASTRIEPEKDTFANIA
jgi:hypothetical protein